MNPAEPQQGVLTQAPTPPTRHTRAVVPGWEGIDKVVRDVLEAPFAPSQIRRDVKRHTDGFEMMYVEAHDVIQRLNDAFNGAWDFTIVGQPTVVHGQVIVHGRLSATYWVDDGQQGPGERMTIMKEQFGSCFIKANGQVYVDIGSDFKAAATDALKKCATQFGIALQLYARDEAPPQGLHRTGPQPTQGTYPAVQANPGAQAMPFQVDAVKAMFAKLGVGDPQWWQHLGFAGPDQLNQGQVTALLAGQHPWVAELMQKAGVQPGLTKSAA